MKELTEKERDLIDFIFEHMDSCNVQPTYREMASHFSSDVKTIADRLEGIEKKGVIKRTGKSRYIVMLQDRGNFNYSRTSNALRSSVVPDRFEKNKRITQPLTHFQKLTISFEAVDILNNWVKGFTDKNDLPIPVPVESVIRDLFNFDIIKDFQEQDISGKLFLEKKLIVINVEDNPQRQRFTIGHELGHLVLHKGQDAALQAQELEADYFAISLLMPLKQFSHFAMKILEKMKPLDGEDLIEQVRMNFDVSIDAARIRLQEFDFLPIRKNKK
jgi:hypothetical protein